MYTTNIIFIKDLNIFLLPSDRCAQSLCLILQQIHNKFAAYDQITR